MSGSKSQSQEFTASGTFNVPTGVTAVWVTAIGAGGGGSGLLNTTNAVGRGGGGSGEFCLQVPVKVTSGGTVTVTIGTGGAGGVGGTVSATADGSAGTDTTFDFITCKAGKGAPCSSSTVIGGDGGGVGGYIANNGVTDQGAPSFVFGGFTGGGAGGRTNSTIAFLPSQCINYAGLTPITGTRPSGDGAPSPWGVGGRGVPTGPANGGDAASTSYGAGGAGCGGTGSPVAPFSNGGRGCDGYVLIEWTA